MPTADIIYLDGVVAQVERITKGEAKALSNAFKFRDPGFQFRRSRHLGWDGYTLFFNEQNGKFLAGLVPEVKYALEKHFGYNVDIYREKGIAELPIFDESLISPDLVTVKKDDLEFPMRDWQMEAIWRIVENGRGIIAGCTGAGKTMVEAALLKLAAGRPSLLLFREPGKALLYQTIEEMIKFGIDEKLIGICQGENFKPGRYMFCMAQSLPKLEETGVLPLFEFLMADEVHNGMVTNSVAPFLRKAKKATCRVGFSATWDKKKDQVHNYKLKGHFGMELIEVLETEMQGQGFLSQSQNHFVKFYTPDDGPQSENMSWIPAYRQYVVENDWLHQRIAKLVNEVSYGRVLVLVGWKDAGRALTALVPDMYWVCGDDKQSYREELRNKMRNAGTKVKVCSTKIFGTGMDIYIHDLINISLPSAKNTDAEILQSFGRGLRKAPDKKYARYFHPIPMMNKHLREHALSCVKELEKRGHQVIVHECFADLFEYVAANPVH